MKEKFLNLIKKFRQSIGVTAFFSVIYLIGWALNGVGKTHFNLGDLIIFYTTVVAKSAITHGINSVFNSPRGTMPEDRR